MSTTSPRRDHLAELLKRRPELAPLAADIRKAADLFFSRSEESRVGKEFYYMCRFRGVRYE